LTHFTANWASYVNHANKIAFIIFSRLIQKNTYEQYVSAHRENLEAIIENTEECIVFFTHVYKHLQNVDLSILSTNIKQMSDALVKVIIKTIKYNLAQVLPQFRDLKKPLYKVCNSSEHFTNQYPNRAAH
jgi:hypothetical protein